ARTQPVPGRRDPRDLAVRLPVQRLRRTGRGTRLHRRHQRHVDHLRRAARDGGAGRGRAGRAGDREGRRGRDLLPQHAVLPGGLPRRAARERDRHERELALQPGRAGPPARGQRGEAAVHRVAVPRPRRRGRGAGRPHRRRRDRPGRRRGPHLAARPAGEHRGRAGPGRRARRHGRAALLLGHHRPGQGRDPHAPQPRGEPPADRRGHEGRPGHPDPGGPAVLPHLRHDRDDEPRPGRERHRDHDAEVRPARVPADHHRAPHPARLHRAAGRRRPGQAPDRRPVRPVVHRRHLLGRRPARRRAGARDGQAAGLHGAAGLRHDRAVAGEPLHARRPPRPGPQLLGFRAAQHRVQARRPGDGRGGRPRGPRRAVGQGPERDGRLPQQPRRHRGHAGRRGLPAHRGRRRGDGGGGVLHRRPGQGADQVQGLPGAAGRAGGPAAHPRPHRRRRRHRSEGRRGRGGAQGVRRDAAGRGAVGAGRDGVRGRAHRPAQEGARGRVHHRDPEVGEREDPAQGPPRPGGGEGV
ncbi:MAG: 4-coumarate--CoA ligase 1, partial [uncultured Pseudonocardia sp.]